MALKKGKSMCFFSAKGGVGKTTNLINLAGIFEQLEKKVLIIDMDLYSGGIALALNKNFDKSIYNFFDDITNRRSDDIKKYTVSVDNYIDILCAPRDPRDANKIDAKVIEDIINKAKLSYDVVLIDTNHALNDINLVTLQSVDQILFVTTNDPMDLKNLKSLLTIFDDLNFDNYKILLNNSRDPFKNYFSMYDIKHILKHNINYTLSSEMYLKDIDKYLMDGEIVSLDDKFAEIMSEDYQSFIVMATDLLSESDDYE